VIDRRRAPPPKAGQDSKPGKSAGKGAAKKAKLKKRRLPGFTLVLATDRPKPLVNALQKRIPTRLHLSPYPLEEMKAIVKLIATEEKVLLSPHAARRLARASQGLPRRAKHLLVLLRLYTPKARPQIGTPDVARFLRDHGIDRDGLGPKEQKYLSFLKAGGKASLDTLALYLGTDREDVQFQVEPILVRMKLVDISPSGRQLTPEGRRRVAQAVRRPKKAVVKTACGEEE
jgi:Holliday junction resolvasome RuvABC ATP-dependent DNA helicase subunit